MTKAADRGRETPPAQLFTVVKESFSLLRPDVGLLSFILFVNLLGAVLTGAGDPLALKLMIDSLANSDVRFFLMLAGLMILVYTSFRLLSLVSNLCTQKLRNRLCDRMVTGLVRKFYRLPYEEIQRRDRGYFVSRLYDEPAKVMRVVALMVDLFSSLAISICGIVVCLVLSWRVSLIVSLIVPILVILSGRYGAGIRKRSLKETEDEAKLREGLGRAVDSYKNVRLFGLHDKVFSHFNKSLNTFLESSYQRYGQSARFSTWSGILLSTAETSVMIVAGFQVLQGRLSIGGLFGFVSAYWRVVNSFQNLTRLLPSFATLGAQLQRIQELEGIPDVQPDDGPPHRQWELRGLTFGYGRQPLLQDLDLRWSAGERILMVGANGSGKSTLAHLVSGFLKAQSGASKTPGLTHTSALLSPCGFIPGTLEDNLSHGSSRETRAYARRLVDEFGLSDILRRDPAHFSDGEKKKAQIIMALVKDAAFYLFDEPLANVDPESKELIMQAIVERSQGRGLLVILHGDPQFHTLFDRVIDLSPTPSTLSVTA